VIYLEKKQIGNWLIEFDKRHTKNEYALYIGGVGCDCQSCQNYQKAILSFPIEVHRFFEELGIDISKPPQVYEIDFKNGIVNMGGWYHIVGNILDGIDCSQPVGIEPPPLFTISDGFDIGFTRDISPMRAETFPKPMFQMEIFFKVPWVLEKEYDGETFYCDSKKSTIAKITEKNKEALRDRLSAFLDITKIDMSSDYWEIDRKNNLGVEVNQLGVTVYFSEAHHHFWDGSLIENGTYDDIDEATLFIKSLLDGKVKLERTYRGSGLIHISYYTKASVSDDWVLQQSYGTSCIWWLFGFLKKTVKTEIIEFRQQ